MHVSGITTYLPSILYPISLSTIASLSTCNLSLNLFSKVGVILLTARLLGFGARVVGRKISSLSTTLDLVHEVLTIGEQTSQQGVPGEASTSSLLPKDLKSVFLRQFSVCSQTFTKSSSSQDRNSRASVRMWSLASLPSLPARPISYTMKWT